VPVPHERPGGSAPKALASLDRLEARSRPGGRPPPASLCLPFTMKEALLTVAPPPPRPDPRGPGGLPGPLPRARASLGPLPQMNREGLTPSGGSPPSPFRKKGEANSRNSRNSREARLGGHFCLRLLRGYCGEEGRIAASGHAVLRRFCGGCGGSCGGLGRNLRNHKPPMGRIPRRMRRLRRLPRRFF
jgi:hypothetical protein